MKTLSALAFVASIGSACFISPTQAAEPQFYPNAKYNNATVSQLQKDIQSCSSKASQYSKPNERGALNTGARTAVKGAALGALGGAITGNAGRGAGAGAAIGGVVGTAKGVQGQGSGNPEFQKYATICLEEKGYKVVSWR